MSAITDGFHALLSGDATLQGLIGSYGGQPAVFTTPRIPSETTYPAIRTWGEVDRPRALDLDGQLHEFTRQVWVHALDTGDSDAVDAAAERVRDLFTADGLAISGVTITGRSVSGPVESETDDESYARVVTVRVWTSGAP